MSIRNNCLLFLSLS